MVNINKLKGKIVEKGFTIEELADEIGINRSTLYRKINTQGESFSIREANMIVQCLQLSAQEASEIFFSQIVA